MLKICKNRFRVGDQAPVCLRQLEALPLDPRVVTLTYYYNFVEFVSSDKCVLLPSKKNKIAREMFCLCFFCTFAPKFHLVVFVDWGRKNILVPGRRVTQLFATADLSCNDEIREVKA